MGMFGDFAKGEKKKKKKKGDNANKPIANAPVFVPPKVIPKGKDKY